MIEKIRNGASLAEAIPESNNPRPNIGARSKRSPECRERLSYQHRLRWARHKSGYDIVSDAYNAWSNACYGPRANPPIPERVKRDIEAFCAAPHIVGEPFDAPWAEKMRKQFLASLTTIAA